MSTFDIGRVTAAIVSLIVIVALIVVLGMRSDPPPPINGDQLGMEMGESFQDYEARASASMSALDDDTSHHFALVTFTEPLPPQQAGEVTETVERVNAMIVANAQPWPLPGPIRGEVRADVYTRELGRIAAPETLTGVVVWDVPPTLRTLNEYSRVATVEVLPADAQWGRFGVSPVATPV
ncbi:hypothetical protein [Corynebacterium cystitidis]|uniref:hypothetical protein n=1 Tax=Corynebacterium cystitidis TaxID=35757 RepID=UPI00211DE2E3|nr:hypothetical protein [Corynebacterium cystitidis]